MIILASSGISLKLEISTNSESLIPGVIENAEMLLSLFRTHITPAEELLLDAFLIFIPSGGTNLKADLFIL